MGGVQVSPDGAAGQNADIGKDGLQEAYTEPATAATAAALYQIARFLDLPPSFFFDGLPLTDMEALPPLDREHATLIRHYDALTKQQRKEALQIIKTIGRRS